MAEPHVKSLIIGGQSMIGSALADQLQRAGRHVRTTSRRTGAAMQLDLAEPIDAWTPPADVDTAYLCAAIGSLQRCEAEPELTRRINVQQTLAVAQRLAEAGTRVVLLSTNLVFDGSDPQPDPQTPPSPQCAYGRQKAEAERGVLALGDRGVVVRMTKIFPPRPPLLAKWIDAWQRGRPTEAFTDLVAAPLPRDVLVERLARISAPHWQRPEHGIVQLSGDRDWSYHEMACHLADRLPGGLAEQRVREGSAEAAGIPPSQRPPRTTLACPEPWPVVRTLDQCLAAIVSGAGS